jgi:stage III sporulation protein AB
LVLKLAGALLLVACGLIIGDREARRFDARHRDLCAMRHALLLLETYVSRTVQPFPRALSSVGLAVREPAGRLMCALADELMRNPHLTLAQGWKRVSTFVKRGSRPHSLPAYRDDDLEVLGRLFGALGAGGRDDQVSHIRLAREALAMNEESARRDLDIYPRLWRYLGAMGGAALALFIV